MAHPIPAHQNPLFKKGDRVQNIDSGIFGTVYRDQTDPLLVHLNWDKYPGQIECFKADAVRVAPWHEINIEEKITVELTPYEAFIVRKALRGFAKNTAKDQGLAATSFTRGLLDSSQEQTALSILSRLELL